MNANFTRIPYRVAEVLRHSLNKLQLHISIFHFSWVSSFVSCAFRSSCPPQSLYPTLTHTTPFFSWILLVFLNYWMLFWCVNNGNTKELNAFVVYIKINYYHYPNIQIQAREYRLISVYIYIYISVQQIAISVLVCWEHLVAVSGCLNAMGV